MPTTLEDQTRWFTYHRQCLGRAAPDPASALRAVLAVPSTHPTAPLALHARAATFDAAGFHALDALRVPAMRGQVHLLPRETAHLALRALAPSADRNASDRLGEGLPPDDGLHEAVLRAAKTPRTVGELRDLVAAGHTLGPLLAALSRAGKLVRADPDSLRSNELRYVAATLPDADPDEALAWLAGAYLHAHGPARVEDFAWWAGVDPGRAAGALATLDTKELGGGLLLHSHDHPALEASEPARGVVDLLPRGDPHLMGHAPDGRARLGDAAVVSRLYDHRGDALPAVLVDGLAAGTWGPRTDGGPGFEARMSGVIDPDSRRRLDERLDAMASLLVSR